MGNELPISGEQPQPAAFEMLLLRLDPQRERAAEQYEILRRKLIRFFDWSSCFPTEDLADETLDRVARILVDRPVQALEAFIWGVARNIRQEGRKRAEKVTGITDLPDHGISIRDSANLEEKVLARSEGEARARCLQKCLRRTAADDREMFLRYHNIQGDAQAYRERLAAEMGLTIGALRVRINRVRAQLEICVQRCLTPSGTKSGGPHRRAAWE